MSDAVMEQGLVQQIAALIQERDERTEWANLGGVPSGRICTYDPNDHHEIYGGGYSDGAGNHVCELHQLRAVTAERDALAAEVRGLREALGQAKKFMNYARYELEEKHQAFEQFPCQECCDEYLAKVDTVLAASTTGGEESLPK